MQYILFLCYKQPVLIYKVKSNNVGKTYEDLMWWSFKDTNKIGPYRSLETLIFNIKSDYIGHASLSCIPMWNHGWNNFHTGPVWSKMRW